MFQKGFFPSFLKCKWCCKYISRATVYLRNSGWSGKPACQIHLVQVLGTVYFGNGTKASWDKAVSLMWEKWNVSHYSQLSCKCEKWINFHVCSQKQEYFVHFKIKYLDLKTSGNACMWTQSHRQIQLHLFFMGPGRQLKAIQRLSDLTAKYNPKHTYPRKMPHVWVRSDRSATSLCMGNGERMLSNQCSLSTL